jgi:hypothetical protein
MDKPMNQMTSVKTRSRAWAAAALLLAAAAGRAGAQQSPPTTVWPLRVESPAGPIAVYEPQPEKLDGNTLTARAAVSLTTATSPDPEFGAMWFTAQVFTDRDARTVTIQNMTIRQVKLPNATPDQEKQFGDAVTQQLPSQTVTFSLDQLEATLGVVQKAREESKQLVTTPPRIVVTNVPTTLVVLDGQPKLQAGQTPGVMRVVNTPFILLLDMPQKQYYLKAGQYWMTASDVTAPWTASPAVPNEIAAEANVIAPAQPPDPNAPPQSPAAPAVPTAIMVAEEPTELICTDGAPAYTPLPGNNLLYMSNTTSDVFLEVATNHFFVLLSGRWFASTSLNGPWTYVAADALPAAFAQIPPDSPKANVLVSVAGTQAAKDARLDAYIPQTTAISRTSGAALTVAYDGAPAFVPVENTPIQYASNCADPVLRVDNGYYCCHQAVWYQSAAAVGPWNVCTAVPQVIYTLPPSCPVYNCRYVYVYDSTPDVVYCGYLPGYTGCYVYGPTVVYGTGYVYPAWYQHEYIPRPYTWGFAPRYEVHSASWGFGSTARYDQTWFAPGPARHDWFGPQGFVDYNRRHALVDNHVVVNERNTVINNRDVTVNRVNIYNRTENVTRNVQVRNTVVNNRETVVNNNHKTVVNNHPAENNVYVGHDGAVYRRTDAGWETHDAKGWTPMKSVPEARPAEPEHAPQGRQPEEHPAAPAEPEHAMPSRETPARETPAHETPARGTPAHDTPARETPTRETPAHETPAHETPAHDTPARETPTRETPAHETPARETPAHEAPARETPARATPARAETPPGGLEEDHAARERGTPRAEPAPHEAEHPAAPAHSGGGGGGGGGGNDANKKK